MFQVSHLSSACILLRTNDCNILCDPVSRNPHYNGWLLYPFISENQFRKIPLHFIFVSHIHEDHYDPCFIKKLIGQNIENFAFKPKVLISKRQNINYLALSMIKDGISPIESSKTIFEKNTSIRAIPFSTGNPLDIDSVLFISKNNKNFLNLNDIIFDKDCVLNLKSQLPSKSIDLLAASYAGAGPFPQCYFSDEELSTQHDLKVSYNKNKLLQMINIFNPKLILPFAGEHLLTGKRYKLNPFRGYYDRFQTKLLDKRCKPLSVFTENFIDIDNFEIKGEQLYEDSNYEEFSYYDKSSKLLEIDDSITSKDSSDFSKLIEESYSAFLKRIKKFKEKPIPYSFNFKDESSSSLLYTLSINESKTESKDYSDVFINKLLFIDILKRDKHWDNIFGGSLIKVKRYGNSEKGYKSENILAFFHK